MKGSFWEVLVFGRAKWSSIKCEMGLSARKMGLEAVQTRKTSISKVPCPSSPLCRPPLPPSGRARVPDAVITPPEVANKGPGVNRGYGGGARGCGFDERMGLHARSGGFGSVSAGRAKKYLS